MGMRHLILLLVHLIATVLRVVRPGGVRAVVAESVLAKHQLLILNRSRRRAPNLAILDRLIAGFCSLWIKSNRLRRVAIAFKPSTLLNFHRAMVQRKYRLLFSPKQKVKPGPKGPTADLIQAVVEMKQRNPTWGCPRIAEQINLAFGTSINKDVVRRILALHYPPTPTEGGPSWLTFIGSYEGQLVEPRPVSMRINCFTNLLGAGRDGSIHAADRRLWHSRWHRRWSGPMPDVQSGYSRTKDAQIPQLGS
jgi:putative transposase